MFVIDPYMDGSIYQALATLTPATMNVRILTSKYPADFALETKKFTKQHSGFTAEVRALLRSACLSITPDSTLRR